MAKYTATVSANSVYRAALAFEKYCNEGPPTFNRPRVTPETEL
jgi:hypothetical protein